MSENQPAVRRVVDYQTHAVVEGDEGDRVVRSQGVDIAAGGRQRFRQWLIRHAAAGVDYQDAGESQLVIGDILHPRDRRQPRQVAADIKVARFQTRDQLPAGIQYAGVNGDLREVGGVDADDVEADAGFFLREDDAQWQ